MSRRNGKVAIVGGGLTAHVVASIAADRGLDVVMFGDQSPSISAIWNGLGSIFGPASRMPADSDGAIERKTPVASPFDATRVGRWERLMERRPSVHPFARFELEQRQVDELVEDALATVPETAIDRACNGTVVPGPHGHPYAADLLAPSLQKLDLRDGQKVGLVPHSGLNGWNARATGLQIDRASGLDTVVVGGHIFDEAPAGHSVRSAHWFEQQWEADREYFLEAIADVSRDNELDLLILPPAIGASLKSHTTIWHAISGGLSVDLAEFPTDADPIFGWRLLQRLRRARGSDGASDSPGWRDAPDATDVEMNGRRVTTVTDASGTIHEVDAIVLTGGRWFGRGLPKNSPLREPLTDAPLWLDGATLPDGPETYPPDLLGKLPWDDHQLFRMGLQINAAGRVLGEDADPMPNVYAAGRVLSGFNPIHDGCSMGVSLVSGVKVGRQLTQLLDAGQADMIEPDSVETT